MIETGFVQFDRTDEVATWAATARAAAGDVLTNPQPEMQRLGGTWYVGVAALPNDERGTLNGTPLRGPWDGMIPGLPLHPAQLSVVYRGFPGRDAGQSDAAHAYRVKRDGAHVDGLLGDTKTRQLKEPHAYILGIALTDAQSCPLVVYPGSHDIMREAFMVAFAGMPPMMWPDMDIGEIYRDARAEVFECCERVELPMTAEQSVLLHRMMVHGIAPEGSKKVPAEGRMMAYFRPVLNDLKAWLRD
jgi:hypothetical protein